jgi:ELWxxDGT repeat protein
MRLSRFGTTFAALVVATSVKAQTPHILKDINTIASSSPALRPRLLTPATDYLYFWGDDEINGGELRRTQGTSATTTLVADLTPGASGGTGGIATVGNVAFFTHGTHSTGGELWRTDGTIAGTQLVRDVHVGPESSDATWLTSAAGLVFMVADDGSGPALWRSDGTPAGTFRVRAGNADALLPGDGLLYFIGSTPANGRELWTSDGTVAGTRMVKDVCPGTCDGSPQALLRAGSSAYFTADDGPHGREVWRTDGTEAGTVMLGEVAPGPNTLFPDLEVAANVLYLASSNTLWRFDASGVPEVLLEANGSVLHLAASGSRLFFFTDLQQAQRLWLTDGTASGTLPVADLCTTSPCVGGLEGIVGSTQYAFYLWSDNGVRRLSSNEGSPGSSVNLVEDNSILEMTVWNDRLYFDGPDDELWSSDGTTTGTGVVFDLTDSSSRPHRMVVAQDRLFFRANNPNIGLEPWVSEGTEASTVGLDLFPGPDYYTSNEFGALGRDLLFSVDGGPGIASRQLWRSDGTLAGTGLLDDVEAAYFSEQGAFGLFSGTADGSDRELWRTDGTPAGTVLVKDLNPSGSSLPRPLSSLGGQRYLRTISPTFAQLWRTDGTTNGTVVVHDNLDVSESTPFASFLILSARDGSGDHELWRSDGTPLGTSLVKDLYLGADSVPRYLTAAGGLVFFVADTPAAPGRLWKTDGTEAGTTRIAESTGYLFAPMTELDGILYFVAHDPATGIELWRSDGTGPGTHIVKDIVPGPDWAFVVYQGSTPLVSAGGWLWFSAYSLAGGLELWRSDGTAARTAQYADIAPGPRSSSPEGLITDGRRLYFFAHDGTRGIEPWVLDTTPVASAADVSAVEGDAPGGYVQFTVSLSAPATTPLTVSYQTKDGTAVAGLDYTPESGTVTFAPGPGQAAIVTVPLLADLTDEPDESFALCLTPGTAQVEDDEAVATIGDDDEPRVLVSGSTVTEGDAGTTPASFEVELVTKDGGVSLFTKSVGFASEPLTAVSPLDFTPTSGTLSFAAGTPSGATQAVMVNVIGDTQDEPDERFLLRISPTSDVSVLSPQADGVIFDDDGIDAAPAVELAHGSVVRATLEPPAGRTSDRDWYVVRQQPRASYEVVVDETSGDAIPLQVERMGSDGSTVLQSATATGTGGSVSLRWENVGSQAISDQPIRVGSAACGTSCGADDGYRVRLYETTLSAPRINNTGTQVTVAILQNTTDRTIAGRLQFWLTAGAPSVSVPFQLTARQLLVLNTSASYPATGTLTVTHDGPYGSLVGKAVALEPATGFSFDTPMTYRPR